MVRRKVLDKGHSRRQMAKETGLSRNTIRKMLLHELPQPYKPRTPRYPALRQHTATLDAFATLNVSTIVQYQVSINEIYRYLKREEIISSSKKDAISILRSLSFNGSSLISSTRLQRLQGHLASLREHQVLCSRHARRQQDADWLARVIRTGVPPIELEGHYRDPGDSNELIDRLHVGSKPVRNRAIAILAHLHGISDHTIATALGMSRLT